MDCLPEQQDRHAFLKMKSGIYAHISVLVVGRDLETSLALHCFCGTSLVYAASVWASHYTVRKMINVDK